jgi:hypothetical protein
MHALGFQEPLDERPPPGLVGAPDATRGPHSNQSNTSRAARVTRRDGEPEGECDRRSRERSHESDCPHPPAPRLLNLTLRDSLSRRPKPRLLTDDLSRQALELLARLETEIVVEGAARSLIDVECVRLATRAVERDHELPDEVLAVGALLDEAPELAYDLRVASQGQIRVDADLERPRPKLVEALHLGACAEVKRNAGKDGTVPET